jgi:hypothetical protein
VEKLAAFIDLVNMGVLAELAFTSRPAPDARADLPVAEIDFAHWSQAPAAQDALRRARHRTLDDALVLSVAAGFSIVSVSRPGAQDGGLAPGLYVACGLTLTPIRSDAAARALTLVDGKRTIGDIVREARVNRSLLLRQLAVAIDEGVLIVQDDPPL